jgi:N,N'-diacetyllegionaminate synthase
VQIGGRTVGAGAPCLVVAEIGVNHNGDPDLGRRLIEAAAEAGADAVKLQTFRAADVVSPSAPKAAYQVATVGASESQLEMLERLELDWDAHVALKHAAQERGLLFLSTPFDAGSLDLLVRLGVDGLKIASPDLVNFLLLDAAAPLGLPLVVSTGMATLDEVERGVARLVAGGAEDIVVLHCTSEYPAPVAEANLRAIPALSERLGRPVGYSDHTEGIDASLAAVALGAVLVERHFTLDRSLPGPDHRASLEPPELAALVTAVRRVEAALGDGVKRPTPAERGNTQVVRRSLAAARDLESGTLLDRGMLTALRPATGISAADVDAVVGRRLVRPVAAHALLQLEDLE